MPFERLRKHGERSLGTRGMRQNSGRLALDEAMYALRGMRVHGEEFAGIPETTRRKILCENAARIYGFPLDERGSTGGKLPRSCGIAACLLHSACACAGKIPRTLTDLTDIPV